MTKKVGARGKMLPVDETDIIKIFEYLSKNNYIVILGIIKFILNTGKPIKDILELKFEDLNDEKFNSSCQSTAKVLKDYYKSKDIDNYDKGYLFKSFKQGLKNKDIPISYKGVQIYFKKIQEDLKIEYPFNTNSFRKFWGKQIFKLSNNNINLVMTMLEQENPLHTLKYIGEENSPCLLNQESITEKEIEEILKKIKY